MRLLHSRYNRYYFVPTARSDLENTWHRPCPAAPGPEAAGGALTSARSCGPLRGGDKPVGSLAPTLLF